MRFAWPLTGRSDEMQLIATRLEDSGPSMQHEEP